MKVGYPVTPPGASTALESRSTTRTHPDDARHSNRWTSFVHQRRSERNGLTKCEKGQNEKVPGERRKHSKAMPVASAMRATSAVYMHTVIASYEKDESDSKNNAGLKRGDKRARRLGYLLRGRRDASGTGQLSGNTQTVPRRTKVTDTDFDVSLRSPHRWQHTNHRAYTRIAQRGCAPFPTKARAAEP